MAALASPRSLRIKSARAELARRLEWAFFWNPSPPRSREVSS